MSEQLLSDRDLLTRGMGHLDSPRFDSPYDPVMDERAGEELGGTNGMLDAQSHAVNARGPIPVSHDFDGSLTPQKTEHRSFVRKAVVEIIGRSGEIYNHVTAAVGLNLDPNRVRFMKNAAPMLASAKKGIAWPSASALPPLPGSRRFRNF